MQMLPVADTPLETPAKALLGCPLQPGRFVACFGDAVSLFVSESLSGKVRLLERPVTLPLTSGHPTAAVYHPGGFYISTSTGTLVGYTFEGTPADNVLQLSAAVDCGTAVTALAANRDVLAAVAAGSNVVHLWPHAGRCTPATVVLHAATFITAIAFGGPMHCDIVAVSEDGLLLTCPVHANPSSASPQPSDIRVLSDTHAGRAAAAAATGRRGEVATVGADGSLRLWDAATATVAAKRTFSTSLTAVAASADTGLLAIGASSGLVRIVAIGGSGPSSIDVLSRVRVSRAPISTLAFAPPPPHTGGALLAALSCDSVYTVALARTGGVRGVWKLPLAGAPLAAAFTRRFVSAGVIALMVSFLSAELQSVLVTVDGRLTGDAERRMKLAAPLASLACLPGPADTIGVATGVSTDRTVRSYELPAAGSGWGGSKGRVARATDTFTASGGPVRARTAVGPVSTALAAHVFGSGAVLVAGVATALQLGDGGGGGGLVDAAFDATARNLLLTAADGSIFTCEVLGAPGVPVVTPPVPAVPCEVDMDTLDDEADDVYGEARIESVSAATLDVSLSAPASCKALSMPQQELLGQFKLLRQRLQRVIDANVAGEPRARLPRGDLVADEALIAELQEERAHRVAAVRAAATRGVNAAAAAAARIRAECWDALAAPPRALCGARSPSVIVRSFPLLFHGRAEAAERQITFLRRVEQAEEHASGANRSVAASRCVEVDAEGRPASDPAPASASEQLLYSDWDLSTASRRAMNVRLLVAEARRTRAAFNAEFERAAAAKAATVEKVEELDKRLVEVGRELKAMGCLAQDEDLECLQVRMFQLHVEIAICSKQS
jgi:hypothetical protein